MQSASTAGRWRVLIADDHAMLREGLAVLIAAQDDMEIVAQAKDGREAVNHSQNYKPDVVVLDVSMPELNGPLAAEQIRVLSPGTKVLALTRHGDSAYLRRMLKAGANGYVVKRAASDTLIDAIRTVAEGGTYLEPELAGSLLCQSVGARASRSLKAEPVLSEREIQTIKLIAWGKSNKEVAAQLGISVKTAEFYKASALEKLGLRTRTDIMRYALAEGWLNEDSEPEE